MKGNKSNKKILGGIILIILIGGVLGYYWTHREAKEVVAPAANKRPNSDSSAQPDYKALPEKMGLKPEADLKDGSVKLVEEYIKSNAKNPGTFKFLEWSEVSTEGGYWKVRCKYIGVSSFNAEVTTTAWFYIRNNKVVYTKVMSKI